MNKKAVEMSLETIVYAAVFLLGVAILIVFLSYKLAPAVEESGNKGIIKAWVLETSSYKRLKAVFGTLSPYPPISSLLKKPIEINTKEQFIKDHKLIADTMLNCFDAFNKGETDFLSPFDLYNSQPFCFQCAELIFDKDLKGQNLNTLKDYMKKESPILTKDKTYEVLLKGQYFITDTVPETSKLYIFFTASTNTVWNKFLSGKYALFFSPETRNFEGLINPKIVVGDKNIILQLCTTKQIEELTPEEQEELEKAEEFWDIYSKSPGL